jgi:hypothetical protein
MPSLREIIERERGAFNPIERIIGAIRRLCAAVVPTNWRPESFWHIMNAASGDAWPSRAHPEMTSAASSPSLPGQRFSNLFHR